MRVPSIQKAPLVSLCGTNACGVANPGPALCIGILDRRGPYWNVEGVVAENVHRHLQRCHSRRRRAEELALLHIRVHPRVADEAEIARLLSRRTGGGAENRGDVAGVGRPLVVRPWEWGEKLSRGMV